MGRDASVSPHRHLEPTASHVTTYGEASHLPCRRRSRGCRRTLKFSVGVLLTSFGTCWTTEGTGADRPSGDASLVGVFAVVALVSAVLMALLRRLREAGAMAELA
jgi:hypothetical protein